MTIHEASLKLRYQLMERYDTAEARNITDWVLEHVTGWSRIDRIINKQLKLSASQEADLEKITGRLMQHEPVQYVLNEAWFCGMKFFVNHNVLIPRPETEELVHWILQDFPPGAQGLKILDIGTGSGCIPITLKTKLKAAELWSCDVSENALQVAKQNAANLQADIRFLLLDFLDQSGWYPLPVFDIIVSNPPYVPESDQQSMQPNVLNFEPHTALFVPDNDSLVFYKAIIDFAVTHLKAGGAVYAEIHENLGAGTSRLFEAAGFSVQLKKDMQGKDRMIKAVSPAT
ncbi:MAG TPA: peptide chain release factor N(5)-glutamine methyltransferase [Chitinophagaceae bacterium]|jgi:release factor glutamine methyltransferase|nr:peptide chain release factor N(5)-glutamine methyltransferase [Chitinophagaceae bacterium]